MKVNRSGDRRLIADVAKTILYSAASVRGVFVCNREELKTLVSALEYGNVRPIIDKASTRGVHGQS